MVKIERWILLYLMDKLGWVPRWMPLLSGTASGYDETGTGASVDAFALGDRQHMMRLGWVPRWTPLLSGTASVLTGYWDGCLGDAFALGDR